MEFVNGKPKGIIFMHPFDKVDKIVYMGMSENDRAIIRITELYNELLPHLSEAERTDLARKIVGTIPYVNKNMRLLLLSMYIDDQYKHKMVTPKQFNSAWDDIKGIILGNINEYSDEDLTLYKTSLLRYLRYINSYTSVKVSRVKTTNIPSASSGIMSAIELNE